MMRAMGRTTRGATLLAMLGMLACERATGPGSTEGPLETSFREAAHPVSGGADDYAPLLGAIGEGRYVLLGESTHGTHEFYRERARISRRLIEDRDFAAVAIEGAWPASSQVDEYVRARGGVATPEAALSGFDQFPEWMWRNAEMRDFARDLRAINDARPAERRVGFYGLDLYSLFESMDAVIRYLDRVDPQAAQRARARYDCFSRYSPSAEAYRRAVAGGAAACTREAADQLQELQIRAAASQAARADEDLFSAEQNARVVRNAEAYYRVAFSGGVSSWNIRDRHMAETLAAVSEHLEARGRSGRVVVWAHNTHVGDARATDLALRGELNLGQLVREEHGADAFLVGLTTFQGTVVAASQWGAPGQRMTVRPALPESHAALFHRAMPESFLLVLRGAAVAEPLRAARLQRAIGVIYLPQSERSSHYIEARLADQFDAVLHFDQTRAVDPLP